MPTRSRADRPGSASNANYRPDIDGLRAIAVLSVIMFHFWRRLLPGGFVGVDIFFVISGFLITTHILHEVVERKFSLAEFYARRVKRIAPAMLVVVGVVILAAMAVMVPEDAAEAAKSGVYSVSSLANVFFWLYQDTGYFGAQGRDLPLLHLWSLGVEEQFYIVWPLLLMLFYRVHRARTFLIVMSIAAGASFVLGQVLFPHFSSFTYYMLPTRAGELLLGAIGSRVVLSSRWQRVPRGWLTLMAVAGLLLLAVSMAFMSEDMIFPGLLALPPTIGATLLILTRRDDAQPVVRLLSMRPLVMVGLISYSAYLWHWPLLTFYRYGFGEPGYVSGLALLALTLLLAWLSYRFVEQPARRMKASFKHIFLRQYFVPAAVLGSLCLVLIYADRAWPSRRRTPYRQTLATFRAELLPAHAYSYVCQRQKLSLADLKNPRCVVGIESTNEPRVVLWGDSNAAQYIGILGTFARTAGFNFRNIEVGACPPLLSNPTRFAEARRQRDCVASTPVVERAIAQASVVIVGGNYPVYQKASSSFLPAFFATIKELTRRGKDVIVLGKVPVLEGFDRRCREKAIKFPLMSCDAIRAPMSRDVVTMNADLQRFAQRTPHVRYYDATSFLCASGVCSTSDADGQILYYDISHLSLAGSWSLGERIVHQDGVPEVFAALGAFEPARSQQ